MKIKNWVIIKNSNEIHWIKKASKLSAKILDDITEYVKPWVSTDYLDRLMNDWILDAGAKSACIWYHWFPKFTCISLNDTVCHWIPSKWEILKAWDILNIDVTTIVNGFFWDTSRMYVVWETTPENYKLIEDAHKAMMIWIEQICPWKTTWYIWHAIWEFWVKAWYWVVPDYGGHWVGIKFHEEPFIHHICPKNHWPKMVPWMVFTVEPMINLWTHKSKVLSDDWTVKTLDGKNSAQFEHTVLVTEDWYEILTKWNMSGDKYKIPTKS